jgi:DUF1680 family protein
MTPEQRKIKRLEKAVDDLRKEVDRQQHENGLLKGWYENETRWRRDFQRLIKDAAFQDDIKL